MLMTGFEICNENSRIMWEYLGVAAEVLILEIVDATEGLKDFKKIILYLYYYFVIMIITYEMIYLYKAIE